MAKPFIIKLQIKKRNKPKKRSKLIPKSYKSKKTRRKNNQQSVVRDLLKKRKRRRKTKEIFKENLF